MKGLIAVCAVAAYAGTASSQIMVFTDRAAWEAAAGSFVVEDFNSSAVQTIAPGATLDTGLLQVTRDGSPNGNDGDLEIRDGGSFGNIDGTNFLFGETGVTPHENTLFGFNGQDVFAFGADFASPFSGDGINISAGGQLFSLEDIGGGSGFYGIVNMSGASLGSVSFVGDPGDITFQELWQADNVSYAVVPTPATAALLGLGGVFAIRRKR
jgi:hypothetical protein